jgi:hypothetical protein
VSLKSPGNGGAITQGSGGSIHQAYTDNSGTPGSTTINTARGRAALPASSAAAITVTCSACAATSSVFLSQHAIDTTAFAIYAVPGAGSFTVTPVASTTGIVIFDFLVVN